MRGKSSKTTSTAQIKMTNMENVHPTDEILQAHLLKVPQDDAVAAHLAVCLKCREKLEAYQFLIDGLLQIKTEPFVFDVNALAMDAIVRHEQQKRKKQQLVLWGMLILPSIVIVSFSIPFLPSIMAVFDSISVPAMTLAIGTGLPAFLFLLADINRQYKTKANQLFK